MLAKLNELANGGQVSEDEAKTLQQLLQQSAMLGLPIETIMNQFQPGVSAPSSAMSQIQTQQQQQQQQEKERKPEKKVKAEPPQPNITKEQQQKLLALEKQLQDPTMQMLMAQGLINPATLCGLDNETAKLLGLAPPTTSKSNQIDPKALLNQPGMTQEMLALMQLGMQPGMGMGQTTPQPSKSKMKKRPAPADTQVKHERPDSRPASRSSLTSSHRAPTPNDAKKRKSDEKVDLNSLPNNMKIPLIMSDGTKVPDGVSNKELKGLLDSNPQIKVLGVITTIAHNLDFPFQVCNFFVFYIKRHVFAFIKTVFCY